MYRTAWTSDKIAPSNSNSRTRTPISDGSGSKNKSKQKETPKSREVKRLEELRNGLTYSQGAKKDPKGGCYCQARTHSLSTYTPSCKRCGLILCSLNQPQFACPHCSSPLFTLEKRDSLIAKIEQEIIDTIHKEEQEKERLIEEARQAAGAFPTLQRESGSTSTTSSALDSHPINQTHTVLSFNSKTKKLMKVSTKKSPAVSASSSRDNLNSVEPVVQGHPRVSAPPPDVIPAILPCEGLENRPWAVLIGDEAPMYMPPTPKVAHKQKKGKGKNKNAGELGKENVS
ncbi:hypothetical protein C8Q75DRAFT_727356 [Abortiporus biennis]|nr:hypothetical protein C8Q75DRAFT_727356 [Abortiporus biennis]